MKHTNYQPARFGLVAEQILKAKRLRLLCNLSNLHASDDLIRTTIVGFQSKRLRYSDQGDFTQVYRGGFY